MKPLSTIMSMRIPPSNATGAELADYYRASRTWETLTLTPKQIGIILDALELECLVMPADVDKESDDAAFVLEREELIRNIKDQAGIE
jgi:hypothetical protein